MPLPEEQAADLHKSRLQALITTINARNKVPKEKKTTAELEIDTILMLTLQTILYQQTQIETLTKGYCELILGEL